MRRLVLLSILFIFIFASTIHAQSWAYLFVVWNGKMYEIKLYEKVPKSDIGKSIGKVNYIADTITGKFKGNASNYYWIGKRYYEIKGISTYSVIAVEDGGEWVKAHFIHKVPNHKKEWGFFCFHCHSNHPRDYYSG